LRYVILPSFSNNFQSRSNWVFCGTFGGVKHPESLLCSSFPQERAGDWWKLAGRC
jgi:hypothetical protein